MQNILLILFGKIISILFRLLNLGDGSTWPGHIALGVNKNFIKDLLKNSKTKIIIVAGTNGKTTTSALLKHGLTANNKSVIQNQSGANLLNGIASAFIKNVNKFGKLTADYAILEIDENTLPLILKELVPNYIILLNLFRDQLDRYGEVNIVASYWAESIKKLTEKTTLILNADDPQIAFLGKNTKAQTLFFGFTDLDNKNNKIQHASDSDYCPNCNTKLSYRHINFSHLGDWECDKCGLKRPDLDIEKTNSTLPGTYNKYNAQAAALTLKQIGISEQKINNSFANFKPAFGRQEAIKYKNKDIQIFLSKNPTSFNQSFQTISEMGAKTILIALNDRIPDGRDVSWIWDNDLPNLKNFKNIIVSGDRAYDMALRLKYENYKNYKTYENLNKAINIGVDLVDANEILFILPTYSAMLETRKILTGKKIL